MMGSQKPKMFVIPAKAEIHNLLLYLGSGLRRNDVGSCFCGNDEGRGFSTFYEAIFYSSGANRRAAPWSSSQGMLWWIFLSRQSVWSQRIHPSSSRMTCRE